MQLKQIFRRATEFIFKSIRSPRAFWEEIAERKATVFVLPHVYLPLLLVTALCGVIGEFISNPEALFFYALLHAIRQVLVFICYFYLSVGVIDYLLVHFGGSGNKESVQLLVVFSAVPVFLVFMVTGLFPFLYPLSILAFYSVYIFYCGASRLFNLPKTRIKAFVISAVLANFVIFAVLSIILWKIIDLFH